MKIRSLCIAECPVPLPRPVRLGRIEIRSRDFLALRLETDEGFTGEALGYVRGTSLFAAMEMLGHRAIGADPLMRRRLVDDLEASNIPGRAAFTRAISLLDIALWDIAAKHARQPLFKLIGGLSETVAVTAVAGYYMDSRSSDDIADEMARRFDEGFERVKVMLDGGDADRDRHLLNALSRTSGRIAADAHWSWSTITQAQRHWRPLDDFGLDFLEDPFAPAEWRLAHELQRRIRTPVAAGEDVSGMSQLDQLVRGISLLRVDATTCGGITGAIASINIAAAAGRSVLPHVFAPLHVHLACAFPNVEGVEVIPTDVAADPVGALLKEAPTCIRGKLSASAEPGVGIALDWDAVERYSARAVRLGKS